MKTKYVCRPLVAVGALLSISSPSILFGQPGVSSLSSASMVTGESGMQESSSRSSSSSSSGAGDDCPPESKIPPKNCEDVRKIAFILAKRKGYAMSGGRPFVMQLPYERGLNDCSTANAHMACMFNDACTSGLGKLLGLRSQAAYHATVLFKGTDGTEFECDFTPGGTGIFIVHNPDTMMGPAYPDYGEHLDPAYDCARNNPVKYEPKNPKWPPEDGTNIDGSYIKCQSVTDYSPPPERRRILRRLCRLIPGPRG
jgi:hypothetical protein